MSRYVVAVEEEDGELVVPIPDELMEEMGWKIGDVLVWEDTEMCETHGEYPGFTLRKKYEVEYEI